MAWKRKEENYIAFLYIKLYITIGWRGSIIGASKNHLGACYARELDRAPLPPRTVITTSYAAFNSTHFISWQHTQ